MSNIRWQSRLRGTSVWQDETSMPAMWWLQYEYRKLRGNTELFRSPYVNEYKERP